MIVSINGISTSIPSSYEEVQRRLKMLGITPTGNPQIDIARLKSEINRRVEQKEEQQKEIKKEEDYSMKKKLEEERIGAQALAEQNRMFFGLHQ